MRRPPPLGSLVVATLVALATLVAVLSTTSCGSSGTPASGSSDPPPPSPPTTTPSEPPPSDAAPPPADETPSTTTSSASPPAAPAPPSPVPAVADDPAGLASQLAEAERAVRDPTTPPATLARQAHTQQVAYRIWSIHPEWDGEVLAAMPADLRSVAQANVGARREFLGMRSSLATEVPAWRIVDPPPAEELLAHYRDAEASTGVGWQYLAAIHLVETGMGRIEGVSTAGAQGPMQFLPETWAAWGDGGDINDPRDAILAAGRYLADKGAPNDMAAAVFAYNRHENYVRAVLAYAEVLAADPAAYSGYYHWQIHYLSDVGDLLLPVGYEQAAPVPAADYLAAHPDHWAGPVPPGF